MKAFTYICALAVIGSSNPALAVCNANLPTSTPTARYVVNAGEALDTETKLTWRRCSVGQVWIDDGCDGAVEALTFEDAQTRGASGWRVPTKDELGTLFSPTCKNPAVNDEVFPDMALDKLVYWTATEKDDKQAWYVYFDGGHTLSYKNYFGIFDRTNTLAVRLVKSAP